MELVNWKEYEEGLVLAFALDKIQQNLVAEAAKRGYIVNLPEGLMFSPEERKTVANACKLDDYQWIIRSIYKLSIAPRINLLNALLQRLSDLHGLDLAVQVYKSEEELAIQSARKRWLKARQESEALLLAYKKEKGDFYKTQHRVACAS
jgi:hypothetical protein